MERINTIGRRKTSIARIYLENGDGKILVNGREYNEYFPSYFLQQRITKPFSLTGTEGKYDVHCNVKGGGLTGQTDAIQLAISRALLKADPEANHGPLKADKLFTRDPRMVERKKYGRKKARKRYQFSKR